MHYKYIPEQKYYEFDGEGNIVIKSTPAYWTKDPRGVKHTSHTSYSNYWSERKGNHGSSMRNNFFDKKFLKELSKEYPIKHICRHLDDKSYVFDDVPYVRNRKSTGWKESTKCRYQYQIHLKKKG